MWRGHRRPFAEHDRLRAIKESFSSVRRRGEVYGLRDQDRAAGPDLLPADEEDQRGRAGDYRQPAERSRDAGEGVQAGDCGRERRARRYAFDARVWGRSHSRRVEYRRLTDALDLGRLV